MKCPIDNEMLVMTERSGIEIDYCPKCRGVWLDRGELDKLVDRAAPSAPAAAPQPAPQQTRGYDDRGYREKDERKYYKKRESFLGELFDF